MDRERYSAMAMLCVRKALVNSDEVKDGSRRPDYLPMSRCSCEVCIGILSYTMVVMYKMIFPSKVNNIY